MAAVISTLMGVLKSVVLPLVMSLLTRKFLGSLVLRFLKAEAERYAERAEQTSSQEDDARAQMFLGVVADLEKAWAE